MKYLRRFNHAFKRFLSTAAAAKENVSYKPFDAIPGPTSVPLVGSLWKYFPIIGDYDFYRLHETGAKKLKEFGSILKEEVAPGVFIVTVFEPEDIAKVYKAEGRYPMRRSHLALEHYRLARPQIYNNGGLLPTNGSEWWRLRSAFQKSLSRIQDVRLFLPIVDTITSEFLDKLIRTDVLIEDALPLLSRLNLELTWYAVFGERLYGFEENQMHQHSIPSMLIEAAETSNGLFLGTDNTEIIWKKFKIPIYKKLERSLTFIEKTAIAAINKKVAEIKERKEEASERECLIEQYLNCPGVDMKDIIGMSIDLLLGGIDTTSYTSCFILYHIGRNKEVQKKLGAETKELLPSLDSQVTGSVLNNASYTRAVLKEVFRVNPISVGISRLLYEDVVLSGYFVPKGTVVITQNQVACSLEKNFELASEFIPERWLRNSPLYKPVSPFLVLPFSHGPRTCIARRLAEQNLLTLIMKVSRKFSISYLGDKLGLVTPIINKPDGPVKVMFNKV